MAQEKAGVKDVITGVYGQAEVPCETVVPKIFALEIQDVEMPLFAVSATMLPKL